MFGGQAPAAGSIRRFAIVMATGTRGSMIPPMADDHTFVGTERHCGLPPVGYFRRAAEECISIVQRSCGIRQSAASRCAR